MIEVIYKDEKQTAKGSEGIWNLPKNIRQIGLPEEEYRIYIEDYVYTFLKKTAEKTEKEETGSVVVFTGETRWDSGFCYLFIKGALLADMGDVTADHAEFSDATWQKLHEEVKQYFDGQEITGWFLTQKSLPMEVSEGLQRIHMKLFGGEKVLMLMDPAEKEEAFFCYANGTMVRQSGYYIYYEKNPQMQAYMLEKNPELNQPEQETVSDDAVRAFRKIIQKKHKDEVQETEEGPSVFSYAATACLVLAVLTVGVQFYQNYNSRTASGTITETDVHTVSSAEVTKIPETTPKAEEKTDKSKDTENTDKIPVTPTSALRADPTPVPVTSSPIVSPSPYREESDTRKAERRVKQEQAENEAKNKTSEDATGSVVTSGTGQGSSYVIKPGDTLYQISISRYGTMEKVEEICKANGLDENEIIYPGQIIVLP